MFIYITDIQIYYFSYNIWMRDIYSMCSIFICVKRNIQLHYVFNCAKDSKLLNIILYSISVVCYIRLQKSLFQYFFNGFDWSYQLYFMFNESVSIKISFLTKREMCMFSFVKIFLRICNKICICMTFLTYLIKNHTKEIKYLSNSRSKLGYLFI